MRFLDVLVRMLSLGRWRVARSCRRCGDAFTPTDYPTFCGSSCWYADAERKDK